MVKKSARPTRRTHSTGLKARVAVVGLRDGNTRAVLCKAFQLHSTQILEWKRQLFDGAADVFGASGQAAAPVDLAPLYAKIGQLALENNFLERALTEARLLGATKP